jgi:FPC/CPF motif-containing protein YcgG
MTSITQTPVLDPVTRLEDYRIRMVDTTTDERPADEPEWYKRALASFRLNVGQVEYPCHFGRNAMEWGLLYTTWLETGHHDDIAPALAAFLDYAQPQAERRQVMAIFVEPDGVPRTHEEYGRQFWRLLSYLHEADAKPWPHDVPLLPEDPNWEFSFHGHPLFVFGAAPTHSVRRSRNLCDSLVLLFQPRTVFDGIEGGTPAGTVARRRIRKRLLAWDNAPAHPSMGDYGDPSNFEWRQYYIAEDDSDVFPTCPFGATAAADRTRTP